jgi:hypothetical protein
MLKIGYIQRGRRSRAPGPLTPLGWLGVAAVVGAAALSIYRASHG